MSLCQKGIYRPTWIEVNLAAIRENARRLSALAAAKGLGLIGVVKADAYGHGAVRAAAAVLEGGAASLAVALVEEGIALRAGGVSAPILVMGAFIPGSASAYAKYDLEVTVTHPEQAAALAREAAALGATLRVHVKVDTGMGRLGVLPADALALAQRVASTDNLSLVGVYSHLATAESEDTTYARGQLASFEKVLACLAQHGLRPPQRHILNSAGLMQHEPGTTTHARVGLALYGLSPSDTLRQRISLQPAMSFRTRVSSVKDVPAGTCVSYGGRYRTARPTRLATLPVGYADGVPRLLSGRLSVLIRGERFPVVGSICMDQAIADVGDAPVEAGDDVILLGSQAGATILPDEWAEAIGTINYEIVSAITARVPRLYIES